jgi:CheY-like chemotaxis protein
LAYHIAPEVPFFLSGDPDHLRQIITNVVGNAIKFTEQGEVQLRIKNEDPREKGLPCRLQFSVTDTGIGIAPDKLSAIFESFVQADSSITRKYGGTGLGLTISKKLVELMGGSMYVTSDLGKGTCFFFSIPFETPKEPPSMMAAPYRPPVIALPLVKSVNRPLRILLVEDSSDNQRLILAYLKKSRHAVDVADNGAIAVKKTAEGSYDLVFMDMQMPVMDGYTATRAIRTWESRDGQTRKATPIIALTAYALKEEIEKSYRAGCTNHLTKPIKKAVLMEMIGRYSMEASLVT